VCIAHVLNVQQQGVRQCCFASGVVLQLVHRRQCAQRCTCGVAQQQLAQSCCASRVQLACGWRSGLATAQAAPAFTIQGPLASSMHALEKRFAEGLGIEEFSLQHC
jgi:hypothetical protein